MDVTILFYILVGFIAQMIDGALGMAYGVSSTSLLLTIGIPPAQASASVHAAELVTTAVSGAFHLKFGNVDKKVLRRLLIPGVIGGAMRAYVLTEIPSTTIKPLVNRVEGRGASVWHFGVGAGGHCLLQGAFGNQE